MGKKSAAQKASGWRSQTHEQKLTAVIAHTKGKISVRDTAACDNMQLLLDPANSNKFAEWTFVARAHDADYMLKVGCLATTPSHSPHLRSPRAHCTLRTMDRRAGPSGCRRSRRPPTNRPRSTGHSSASSPACRTRWAASSSGSATSSWGMG